MKDVLLFGLLGQKPPVHTDAVVKVPAGHPARAKLTGLTGIPRDCKAMIASTMLFLQPAKKKSLSFLMGPPSTPPNCFSWTGVLAQAAGVAVGAHVSGALSIEGL